MNAVLYLLFIFVVLLQRKIPSGHTYWQGVLLFYSSRRFLSDFYCGRGEAFHVLRNVLLTDDWYFSSSRPFRIFTGCCYLKLLLFSGLAIGFLFYLFHPLWLHSPITDGERDRVLTRFVVIGVVLKNSSPLCLVSNFHAPHIALGITSKKDHRRKTSDPIVA